MEKEAKEKKVVVEDKVETKAKTEIKASPAEKKLDVKTVLAILVLILLVVGSYGWYQVFKVGDVGVSGIKTKVQKYLVANIPKSKIAIKTTKDVDGLYQFSITVNGKAVTGYATKNGKLFFTQAYDMTGSK